MLNAPVEVDTFHRPWVMKPFAVKGLGEAYLRLLNPPTFRWLMRHQGIADLSKITTAELDASVTMTRLDPQASARQWDRPRRATLEASGLRAL